MNDGPDVTTYEIDVAAADVLAAAAMLPREARRLLVARLLVEIGPDGLADLFVEFIALANSVAANTAAMADLILLEAGMHPHDAARANMPTVAGAMAGVRLALTTGADPDEMCIGCAFRVGTPANQSPSTTVDAAWSIDRRSPFLCHEDVDADHPVPRLPCAGYVKGCRDAKAREIRAVK